MKRHHRFLFIVITIILIIVLVSFGLQTILFHMISVFFWRVLVPFIMAILISYLLYPLLMKLTDLLNMNRTSAIVVIFILFFSLVTVGFLKGIPLLIIQLEEMSEQLPQLISLYEQFIYTIDGSIAYLPESIRSEINLFIIHIEGLLEQFVNRILKQFVNAVHYLVSFLMIPVLVFYMLKDFKIIKNYIIKVVPEKYQGKLERILAAVHEALGTYIRGQSILSLFIFSIAWLLFTLIQLKYAFVLAIFMGLMNVIPYFGPVIGTLPAIVIALATSWQLVIYVLIIASLVQLVESSLLSPYIMGKTARLHPLAIIFILLVSSEIGGIIGMIVAIPLVMIVRAIILNLRAEKQQCIDN